MHSCFQLSSLLGHGAQNCTAHCRGGRTNTSAEWLAMPCSLPPNMHAALLVFQPMLPECCTEKSHCLCCETARDTNLNFMLYFRPHSITCITLASLKIVCGTLSVQLEPAALFTWGEFGWLLLLMRREEQKTPPGPLWLHVNKLRPTQNAHPASKWYVVRARRKPLKI